MKTDVNGCSTCPSGKEQHETFYLTIGRKKVRRVQYDYRHTDGELFSCVATSLDEARRKRNEWLSKKS
ncbi:MAG: DUF3873 family protein [Bacteroidales bacterium]|nr:DUF3873 family protein [Bacteroidales bacterium]